MSTPLQETIVPIHNVVGRGEADLGKLALDELTHQRLGFVGIGVDEGDLLAAARMQVAALRAGSEPTDDLPALQDRVLATIDRATRVVDTMETS